MKETAEVAEMLKTKDYRAATFYDTVAVPMFSPAGCSYELFRDVYGKGPRLTNLRTPRRIVFGARFAFDTVTAELTQWSGDAVVDLVRALASVNFKINDRLVVEAPLEDAETGHVTGLTLVCDEDDLVGNVAISSYPNDWPKPTQTAVEHATATVERELTNTPPWLKAWAPQLKVTTQEPRLIQRDVAGVVLVRLTLHGWITKPVGH